jgi:DNA-binding NarL/FixJ family response regulator
MAADRTGRPLRLLLAERRALFRAGMLHLLEDLDAEVAVVEVAAAAQAEAALAGPAFDLILADPAIWPGGVGPALAALHRLAAGAPVVMLSEIDDPRAIRYALAEGAAGYIPKDSPPRVMLAGLRLVLAGGVYLPAALLDLLPGTDLDDPFRDDQSREPLTGRQRAVLVLLATGAQNKEIARALHLSEGAVKAHIAGLLRMLNARNRTEAIVRATERGWLPSSAAGEGAGAPSTAPDAA